MKHLHVMMLGIVSIALMACNKSYVADVSQELPGPETRVGANQLSSVSTTVINVTPSTSLNSTFWANVQSELANGPVDVVFADGTYNRTSTVTLNGIGDDTNLLTLKTAVTEGGAVFTGAIANLFSLSDCKNVHILRLKFTGGATGYALRIGNSQDILVEKTRFVDLPDVGYGALGVHSPLTNRVVVKYCHFENVGYDSHAHMIYGAYGIQRLIVVSNTFQDCSGSFVRFRGDLSDKGVVYNNVFVSSGTYMTNRNPIFVEIPVFNNVNPGDERMGTNFVITKNSFSYGTVGNQVTRFAVTFHSSGFNPADRNYLVSPEDGLLLHIGTVAEKRAIMSSQLGLNGDSIKYGGNTKSNVQYDVVYRVGNAYGSSGPWTGRTNITNATSSTGLPTTEAAAIGYYP